MTDNRGPNLTGRRQRKLYCRLCWQEFDHPSEHDAGSMHGRQRLNGHCKGDINRTELKTAPIGRL